MSTGPSTALEQVRREYESSLSWRVTRPLRAVGRAVRGARRAVPQEAAPARFDAVLEQVDGERLRRIDAACRGAGPEAYALFRDLDSDVWALLLTQQHTSLPNIGALLPTVPEPAFQELWNGASGVALAAQGLAFYDRLRERYAEHSAVALEVSRVLDFGCGWGRLTRFLARDVAPGRLYGCDPVEGILDVCRDCGVPATLARSDFVPDRLPFDQPFDLAFAFSVFTHLSEDATAGCLRALHAALRPGALLLATVRPPEYLWRDASMRSVLEDLGADPQARLAEPRHLFVAHPTDPAHPQQAGGGETYGEAVVTLAQVRERWSEWFELQATDVLVADPFQVVLTLRRGV
jgi:SAM-dependent methyltransferase